MKKLFIIDWSWFLYRAYYAFPEMFDDEGQNINVVFWFFRMILKIFFEKPDYFVITRDAPTKTKRHDQFPEYKANRAKSPDDFKRQIPIVQSIAEELKIPSLVAPGYEADDIIFTVAKMFEQMEDLSISIYSADKDLKQLLSDKISVIDPIKSQRIVPKDFLQEFMFEPIYIVDYLSLIGDSADNIKWVPGIWPKTAIKLIQEFHTIENIYDNIDKVKPATKEKLLQYKQEALESKRLIQLWEVPNMPTDIDSNKLDIDFDDYEWILTSKNWLSWLLKVIKDLKNKYNTPEQQSLF